MTKLADKFWLWGQTAGSHHVANNNTFNLPGINRMEPAEGAKYLGINNCCRVVMGGDPEPPFDEESRLLAEMDQLVWSILGDCDSKRNDNGGDDLDEVLRQADMFPNITGAVLDDFFSGPDAIPRIPIDKLKQIKKRLATESVHKLDLWMVTYDLHMNKNISKYLNICDIITFWTWCGSELINLKRNFKQLKTQTPGKRYIMGCYMWDYGEGKPLTIEQMEYQCAIYLDWLRKDEIEGIIFCSNCIADLDLDTVKWTRAWINNLDKY